MRGKYGSSMQLPIELRQTRGLSSGIKRTAHRRSLKNPKEKAAYLSSLFLIQACDSLCASSIFIRFAQERARERERDSFFAGEGHHAHRCHTPNFGCGDRWWRLLSRHGARNRRPLGGGLFGVSVWAEPFDGGFQRPHAHVRRMTDVRARARR